jgi:hypothetical protein
MEAPFRSLVELQLVCYQLQLAQMMLKGYIFSIAGKIYSRDRSSWGSKMFDMLAVMFYWLTDDFLQLCMNEKLCKVRRARLAHLSNNMEVLIGRHYHQYDNTTST